MKLERVLEFSSDHTSNFLPEVLGAIQKCGRCELPEDEQNLQPSVTVCGPSGVSAYISAQGSYGNDMYTAGMESTLRRVFERDELYAFCVSTGTAANSLALCHVCPPWQSVITATSSHLVTEEGGAPTAVGGGVIFAENCEDGKWTAPKLDLFMGTLVRSVHRTEPRILSIANSTELGTIYTAAELELLCETAHQHDLLVHLDGARLSHAIVAADATPAQLTWRAGVDLMSLGLTKAGAICAELVVFFHQNLAAHFPSRIKRGGHLACKTRFQAAQVTALIRDGLWLKGARHANSMASWIATQVIKQCGVVPLHPVQANAIFYVITMEQGQRIRQRGLNFYWAGYKGLSPVIRLVTSFASTEDDVAQVAAILGQILKPSTAITQIG